MPSANPTITAPGVAAPAPGGSASALSSAGTPPFVSTETQLGDTPLARFGHSTTYTGDMNVVLFGGAVGDSGRYQITNDTYLLDVSTLRWSKVIADNVPSPRAAHAAACVDAMQLVIYGGATGGGSLSTDELYLLDFRKSPALAWLIVPTTTMTPGRRYGHTLVFFKPNLIVFGGNDGQRSLNDIWFMDVERSPFCWNSVQIAPGAKQPPARVYHSAEICREGPASGMMVIFGGRTTDNQSLRDVWGLRQHRDGRWDWVLAPVKKGGLPDARFQHTALFIGAKMLIIGGREGEVAKILATAVYDTEACEWKALPGMGRFRHSSWGVDGSVYTFGGFDHHTQTHPTRDLQCLDLSAYLEITDRSTKERRAASVGGHPTATSAQTRPLAGSGAAAAAPETPASVRTHQIQSAGRARGSVTAPRSISTPGPGIQGDPWVRLSAHVHTKVDSPHHPDFSALVRKISIDRLEDEGRKIRGHSTPLHPGHVLQTVTEDGETFADRLISRLLRPNVTPLKMERDFNSAAPFIIPWSDVSVLCEHVLQIVSQEPMVLKVRAPIKVYGDIHGQYYDLMRLFGSYKCPVEEDWRDDNDVPADVDQINGDIDSIDYLFLGDFVDRGTNSLEVICLLFAIKAKYPRQVHLIRGNHEDPAINSVYGFKEECRRRLRENTDQADSCWERFNRVFECLPVAAVIDDRILCIHGGIGGTINSIQDIAELKRPLTVSQIPTTEMEQRVTDLLWSDPTDNDSITGVVPNDIRDPDRSGHIVKYGPDRVIQFLNDNKLDLIIRAHECVMDGFERFAGGRLITLFSATDYCSSHKNAGALLFIRRDLTVIPKIIFPADREMLPLKNTWINLDSRPPTPPRAVRRAREADLGF